MTKHFLLVASVFLIITTISPDLRANPKGGGVKVGNVTITETPGGMTITQGDRRAIIHWQDFSIGAGELTQFIHPDSKAATLNRVVGGIPSSILGTLKANGQVFLINPNGILVGPTGVINTAGFVASTLDVPDAQFMAGGDMNFSGPSMAGVVNLGSITATDGDVILMARTVENAGTINAPNGVAALAAGNDILMQAVGDERVVVKSGIAGGGTGVSNTGAINAAQAELKAAGGNVYALAVNNTGIVKATGIAQKNGRVILSSEGGVVQNSGQLVAKNADGSGGTVKMNGGKGGAAINNGLIDAAAADNTKPGGTVEILGDTITIGNASVINASGSDGGVVAIGVTADTAAQATPDGGIATLAADPKAKAAQQAAIQANSVILANAANVGKGGTIVVWSEQQTTVGGTIEARGGELGGDGGLVETSARRSLTITDTAAVRASAPLGKAGQWLLDPEYDFYIVAGAGLTNNSGATGFTPTGNDSSVGADLITNQLNAGTAVTLTTSGIGGAQNGDIFVNAAVGATGAATFTLNAARHIVVNNTIGAAGSNVDLVMIATAGGISFAGGSSVNVKSVSATASGAIDLQGAVVAQSGNATLISQTSGITFNGGSVQGTLVDLRAAGQILSTAATTDVTATSLMMQSGPQGIGSSGNALGTSVSNLEARVGFLPSPPVAGGIFIENTGVTSLSIGGVTNLLSGVQVPIDAAYDEIFINTVGSLYVGDPGGDRVTGPADVGLFATGDLKVFNDNANSVRSHFGAVSLSSGGQMEIGEFFTARTAVVRGANGVNLLPSGALVIRQGSTVRADGTSQVFIMGGDQVSLFGGRIETNGGDVTIFAGPGTLFSTSAGINAGIHTTLNPAVQGDIYINSDILDLAGPVNAGGGDVIINPIDVNRSVDLGTENAAKLSLTNTELSKITAATLNINAGSTSGTIRVTAPVTFTSAQILNLAAFDDIAIDSTLNRESGTAGLYSAGGRITGTGTLSAGHVAMVSGADIDFDGRVVTSLLDFQALTDVFIDHPSNEIVHLGASEGGTGFGGINIVDGVGNLTIDDDVTSNGLFLGIKTAGNLFINPGATLASQGLVQLDISNGNLVNSGGPGAIAVPGGGGRYIVYERDPFPPHNKGGLGGSDFTTHTVSINDLDNDPIGVGDVFYYTNLTPQGGPPPSKTNPSSSSFSLLGLTGPLKVFLKTYRLPDQFDEMTIRIAARQFKDVSFKDTGSVFSQMLRKAKTEGLTQQELLELDSVALAYFLHLDRQLTESLNPKLVEQFDYILDQERRWGWNTQAAREDAVADVMRPNSFSASEMNLLFDGLGSVFNNTAFNLGSLNPDQIRLLGRDQLLRMAALKGVKLDVGELIAAKNATMTQENFAALFNAGGGALTTQQFAAMVAAGAGNLTIAQIVAAGAGNLIGLDGGSLQFQVVGRNGQVLSHNGGALTVFELAKLIGQDGGSLVGNSGNTLIGQDGGSLIGQDGGSLVGNSGNTLIGQDGGSLIGQDGGSLVGNSGNTLIGQDGGSLIGQDGGSFVNALLSFVSNDASSLIGLDSGSLIGQDGGSLIGQDGGSLIGNSGNTLIGNSGNTLAPNAASLGLLPQMGAGIMKFGIPTGGAGLANPLINNSLGR